MPVPLLRAATSRNASPLPDPWPGLAKSRFGVQFLRGQLHMLAGAPGAGKTMLALEGAIRMNVPTLYYSADSNERVMATRAVSAITHHKIKDVAKAYDAGLYGEIYGDVVRESPIRFEFNPSEPSIEDIDNATEAFAEVWGHYPHLLIVDNLMNMRGASENEWTAMRTTTKDLHWLAREKNSGLVVLHHTSEQDSSWIQKAPPRSAIQGKVSQIPAVILTVANNLGEMWIGVVKNRDGESDPMAANPIRFIADLSTVRIWDEPMMAQQNGGLQ